MYLGGTLRLPRTPTAATLVRLVPHSGWQRLSCGDGAKGPRLYNWALVATTSPAHHLLIRWS